MKCIGVHDAMLTALHNCYLVSPHNALYFQLEREHGTWEDQIMIAKETMITAIPLTEQKS